MAATHQESRTLSNTAGFVLSIGCVIHCMLMPICLASLPSLGLSWLASPFVHQSLALVGIAIGLWTLVPGWRTHQRSSVLILALVGLSIMNYAAFAGDHCCSVTEDSALPQCCQS